jgi:hypothetical protein
MVPTSRRIALSLDIRDFSFGQDHHRDAAEYA